jgi:ubiquinol-cytochrome c reductase cytochrome b subunit
VFTVGFSLLAIALLVREGYRAPWSPVMDPGPLPASVTQGLTDSAAAGAQVFTAKACHSCHAIGGSGGHRGPDLSDVGLRLSKDQLIARILTGATNMPAFAGNIDPAELDQLVDFLATRRARPGLFTAPSGE